MSAISRRSVLAGIAATAAASSLRMEAATPKSRPNILFAFADDWSYPHASIDGDPVVKTPVFDRICREGVQFRNAYVTAPSCTPSRASVLTGQWPWRLGEGANLAGTLPAKYPVYPDLLEAAGYHVGFIGKGWGPGNDTAGGRKRNPAGKLYSSFDDFMAARPKDAPFCLWFGSHDPHRPYKPDQYKGVIDPAKVHVPPFLPDRPETRIDLADYYTAVQKYDHDTGVILDYLEKHNEFDNTMFVMAGDNGFAFPRCKANLYDLGTHVPLAIRWKGHTRVGVNEDQFVSLHDLAPTFLQAAGVTVPSQMTGRALQPLLRSGAKRPGRDYILTGMERHMGARGGAHPMGYPMRAVRQGNWLYIRNFKPERWPAGDPACKPFTTKQEQSFSYAGFADIDAGLTKALLIDKQNDPAIKPFFELSLGKRPAQELYDLATDPYQLHNLAADPKHAAKLHAMDTLLTTGLKKSGDPRLRGVDLDKLPLRHTPDFEAMRLKSFEGCPTT